jgi:hypothetical protein
MRQRYVNEIAAARSKIGVLVPDVSRLTDSDDR